MKGILQKHLNSLWEKKRKKKRVPNTTTKSKCKSANRTKQKFLHTSPGLHTSVIYIP